MGKIGEPELTEDFIRIRMRNPKDFIAGSFRVQDIGRKGYSKRLAGRLKKSNKWATATWLVSRREPTGKFLKLVDKIEYQHKRERKNFDRQKVVAQVGNLTRVM